MRKCDKRNSHISSKPHMVYISANNDRHHVTKTFTPLHYICRHVTSSKLNFTQLHFTTLHYPLIWFNPIYISYCFISPHITTLYLTSFLCTLKTIFATLLFLSLHPVYNCFPNSLANNFWFKRDRP